MTYFDGFLGAESSVAEHQKIISELIAKNFAAAADMIESNWKESFQRRLSKLDIDKDETLLPLQEE